MDISPYENGTLEFDAVGAVGGETFSVGFVDVVTERLVDGEFYTDNDEHPHQTSVTASTPLGEELTTEWKHYSVPLKDIFDSNSIFSSSSVQMLNFTGDENPKSFWLSNIVIKSPDKASYAPIKVNQIGYMVDGEKYALVSGYYDELTAIPGTPFQVKKASDMSVAYSGELSLVAAYDASSGEKVLKADFSGLNEPGEYVLTVDGVSEPSVAFQIGDGSIYSTLLKDVQKFFYFQRANEDLLAEHAGIFARTGERKEDQNLPFQSDPTITKDVSGGWWDAGDLGKYVTVGATAISDLLWAYESYPGHFQDHSLNIPESGNGIPDLLDEIKVETDFILKMQDEATGGFYAFVNREHSPDRYIMDGTASNRLIPTFHTGAAVGALAHAYIVMKDFPGLADYAETMKAAAIRGWEYLEDHPEFIPQPDGPYNSDSDVNDRFYAAPTLYRATGEQVYNDYVVANYLNFASTFENETFSHNIGSLHRMGFYHYMMGEQPDAAVKTWFTDKFVQWRDIIINANMNKSVWGNSTLDGYYWGANSNNAGVPVGLAIGSRILGLFNEDDIKVAADNLNYLLGVNPLQMSYITGHKERRVTKTIHEIYNGDYLLDMPNGYMPGGPNNNGRYTFSGKAYNGSSIDWETNETATMLGFASVYNDSSASGVVDDLLNQSQKTYTVFESASEQDVVIRIVKLSEAIRSTVGIQEIRVNAVNGIQPTQDLARKIEIIGDSITAGYGVDDVKENGFSTATEDVTKTYAYKTAAALKADHSIVAYSGHGIVSGYTGDGVKNTGLLVPNNYDIIARTAGRIDGNLDIHNSPWDFNKFVPDLIVINLGTNDYSYTIDDPVKQAEYRDTYVQFLKQVRSRNANAHLMCTLGIMGDSLYPMVEQAVAAYSNETGDTHISAMKFDVQLWEDGFGADWHPSEATQTKAANKLIANIKTVMGW